MSADLFSSTGTPADPDAWRELEDVFAELGRLARANVSPETFYGQLLAESVRALSAVGGVVWLRSPKGSLRPVVELNWPGAKIAANPDARAAHEALLTDVATAGHTLSVPPQTAADSSNLSNPTDHALVIGPVQIERDASDDDGNEATATLAIIEILQRPDASPSAYRGYEQFVESICELAADFHTHGELTRLRHEDSYREQLLRLGTRVHRVLDLKSTAYAVANDGRRVVGCDRLSVLAARGKRCRLLAASGVSRVERRSGAVRQLEAVANMVLRSNEAAFYSDGQSDALPQVADALEEHADHSHARQVAVIPLTTPPEPGEDDETNKPARPSFVLVAEQFDAASGGLDRDRLIDVGRVSAVALENARQIDYLPLFGLLRLVGRLKRAAIEHLSRTLLVVVAVAAAVAALVLVPADFEIETAGTLEPIARREVFAPRSGLVDEVLVAHGADVAAGDPLVQLRDPQLELDLKRVSGELETTRQQIAAVRATRTNRPTRDENPSDIYRLSAEERELGQELENLQRQLELLEAERENLLVRSPIAGRVLTWDVANRLIARPVERGEVLVSVADLSDDWQLELDVPDDRIGYILAAQEELGPELAVRFRLSSDDDALHTGHVQSISQTASVQTDEGPDAEPSVEVLVALDKLQLNEAELAELRPGVSARAQIDCGRRPIGYVWLHDIWDTLVGWLRF